MIFAGVICRYREYGNMANCSNDSLRGKNNNAWRWCINKIHTHVSWYCWLTHDPWVCTQCTSMILGDSSKDRSYRPSCRWVQHLLVATGTCQSSGMWKLRKTGNKKSSGMWKLRKTRNKKTGRLWFAAGKRHDPQIKGSLQYTWKTSFRP